MALIGTFITKGVQAGQQVTLKLHELFWFTVGRGQVETLSDFGLEIKGQVDLTVYKGDLHIVISLTDEDASASSGPCRFQFNEIVDDQATYKTHDDKLDISTRLGGTDVNIRLSPLDSDHMTECKVSGPLDLTAYIETAAS